MAKYAAAIDQGTTSTRCMIFDHGGQVVSVDQKEHEQIFPKPGWVEHDANEIWERTQEVIDEALEHGRRERGRHRRRRHHQPARDRRWSGTARPASRSTTRSSGRTRAPTALSTSLARTAGRTRFQEKVGLPLATYFSGPKIRWILDNVDGRARAAEAGDLLFGNMDTWLIWNLTGGTDGGLHITDVDQRQPHDADGPRDARLGRRDPRRDGHPAGDAAGDQGPRSEVYGEVRRAARCDGRADRRRSSATSRRRRSARPASRRARRRTPTAPATSCCSTPAPRRCRPRTAC